MSSSCESIRPDVAICWTDIKAFGKNWFAQISHILRQFLWRWQNLLFFKWNHFWATFIDIWWLFTGHTVLFPLVSVFTSVSRASKWYQIMVTLNKQIFPAINFPKDPTCQAHIFHLSHFVLHLPCLEKMIILFWKILQSHKS